MIMEIISKLPDKKGIIGIREISKAGKAGKIKSIVVASNCPMQLFEKIREIEGLSFSKFDGDEAQLGTKLGKPFPVAMVGYD